MDWLQPAILSTLISSIILFLIYLYLYFKEDEKGTFIFWVAAWFFYILRFLFRYIYLTGDAEIILFQELSIIFSLLSGVFLFQGAHHLFINQSNKIIYIIASILSVWTIIVFHSKLHVDFAVLPVYAFLGCVFIYSGILFLLKVRPGNFESRLIAVTFILWGLHKFDYPFLRNVESIAPIGYTIGAVFAILVAFSISLFYLQQTSGQLRYKEKSLQKINEEIQFNNERLESLLEISQMNTSSTEELVTRALNEAIRLTRSKIGFIYYYDEASKIFTLNAWSEAAMNECKVVDKQTIYHLENTGCWGETVRQRKPLILNDYEAPNSLKKGLPEGHVKLKKFLSVPVFDDGNIVAVVGVANKIADYNKGDITQLTLLMDSVWRISEKIRLIKDLEKALVKAKESDTLKSAFLQNMSHEIRTPMNGIIGFSDILKTTDLSKDKFNKYLDVIINSSNQLLSVVNDIITISALETKQEKINDHELGLNELVSNVFHAHQERVIEKGLTLKLSKGLQDGEDMIISDSTKLTQILNNLLTNAIKFTEKGEISLSYRLNEDRLEFEVKDTGVGIETDHQEIIFERFRQADSSPHRKYGGSGLGLSISKGLIDLLGGKIWVESEKDKGATFKFFIPYKPGRNIRMAKQEVNKVWHKDLKILVAEDEITNFMYIEELFYDTGVTLIHARNGQQAVDICLQDADIKLVLMDIKMPVMDGYTAAKKIKTFRSDLPIIAQTAYALDIEVKKYKDAFEKYLTKPLEKEQLFEFISETVLEINPHK